MKEFTNYSWGKFVPCFWSFSHPPSIQDHFLVWVLNFPQTRWPLRTQRRHPFQVLSATVNTNSLLLNFHYAVQIYWKPTSCQNLFWGLGLHKWTVDCQNLIWRKWNLWEDIKTVYSATILVPKPFQSHRPFWKTNTITQVLSLKNSDMHKLNWILHSIFLEIIFL